MPDSIFSASEARRSGSRFVALGLAAVVLILLIAAVVLFLFGTGPIKGFAITLSIGIVASMFTAIMGTRALVNLLYGGRRLSRLSI